MLGGVFALIAAVTFAWTNAAVRRGVVTGTAVQATTLSIPIGVPLFFVALLLSGQPARLPVQVRILLVLNGGTRQGESRGQQPIRLLSKVAIPIENGLNFAVMQ